MVVETGGAEYCGCKVGSRGRKYGRGRQISKGRRQENETNKDNEEMIKNIYRSYYFLRLCSGDGTPPTRNDYDLGIWRPVRESNMYLCITVSQFVKIQHIYLCFSCYFYLFLFNLIPAV